MPVIVSTCGIHILVVICPAFPVFRANQPYLPNNPPDPKTGTIPKMVIIN